MAAGQKKTNKDKMKMRFKKIRNLRLSVIRRLLKQGYTTRDIIDGRLTDADLACANLTRANLADADLIRAYLACANLADADLTDANLADAYLAGANLADANLADAIGYADAPTIDGLDAKILESINRGGTLAMENWHTCETTYCRAGWAIHLAGKRGAELEQKLGSNVAGALIYHKSTGRVPDFFASDKEALADIKRCAGVE